MKNLVGPLCLLALLLAFAAPVARASTIIPREGHYSGHDGFGKPITFLYSKANGMSHFTIFHSTIPGNAYVSHAMWHETWSGGYSTRGAWEHASKVHGYHRTHAHHHKVPWVAHWVRH